MHEKYLAQGLTHLNAIDMLATICIVIQSSVCAGYASYLVNAEERKVKGELISVLTELTVSLKM